MGERDRKNPNDETRLPATGFITKASALYSETFPLRALVQGLPMLGSPLDTMLAGLGANWRYERLECFLIELGDRLRRVEGSYSIESIEPSEPLFDFMLQVFDRVVRSRSEDKRRRFANLVTTQVVYWRHWDEADPACRLIADLSDVHVQILDAALRAEPCDAPFKGLRVVRISDTRLPARDSANAPTDLRRHFPTLSHFTMRIVCAELVSRGLLRDEGVNRFDGTAMELFVATELAEWLMAWISEPATRDEADGG